MNQPYIYTLFYLKYDVNDYIKTVVYATQGAKFEVVKTFGKYNFYIPENRDEDKNAVYIVKFLDEIVGLEKENYNIKEIEGYFVVSLK